MGNTIVMDDEIDYVPEQDEPGLIPTVKVNETFSVRDRLNQLQAWEAEFRRRDEALMLRQRSLRPKSKVDRQIGAAIARQRRRLRILLAQRPLEVITKKMDSEKLLAFREELFNQFVSLEKSERLLWLNNFEFIMTGDLKKLYNKLERIRTYRSLGQQRCLLVGGPSGMGKTTCLNALMMRSEPDIRDEITIIPVIKIDAPANNKSSRALYRRIINSLGLSYLSGESEEELAETAIAFMDACQVELLIIDEVEHIKDHELKRKVLDLSNQTRGIPIICASCNPISWTEGDAEISGRWNDFFPLNRYDRKKLGALLAYLEILLPFSQPSHLDEFAIRPIDKDTQEGPAGFIYRETKGILRDVMILVRDACKYAIDKELPNIDMKTLKIVWAKIQENPNPRNGDEGGSWAD